MGVVLLPFILGWCAAIPAGIVSGLVFSLLYYRVFRRPPIQARWLQVYRFGPLVLMVAAAYLVLGMTDGNAMSAAIILASIPMFTIVSGWTVKELEPPYRRPKMPSAALLVVLWLVVAIAVLVLQRSGKPSTRSVPTADDVVYRRAASSP